MTFHRLRWFFFGAHVLLLETCSVFMCFFRACVPRLHVCIVFAGFCRSTFSHAGSLYRFSCFFRAGDPRQHVCIVFACFCLEACTVFISFCWCKCSQTTCSYHFQLVEKKCDQGNTTNISQVTDKLHHIMFYRVDLRSQKRIIQKASR